MTTKDNDDNEDELKQQRSDKHLAWQCHGRSSVYLLTCWKQHPRPMEQMQTDRPLQDLFISSMQYLV